MAEEVLIYNEIEYSIVITCFNKRNTIARAIKSAIEQKCTKQHEVIVIDDCSTDSSPIEIQRFLEHISFKTTPENSGPLAATLLGLSSARGKYVLTLDGDDNLVPGVMQMFTDMAELDEDTIVRGSLSFSETPDENLSAGVPRIRRTYSPGRRLVYSKATGSSAQLFPLKIIKGNTGAFPGIFIQDHILPGTLSFFAEKCIILENVTHKCTNVGLDGKVSENLAQMLHDRLLAINHFLSIEQRTSSAHSLGFFILKLQLISSCNSYAKRLSITPPTRSLLIACLFRNASMDTLLSKTLEAIRASSPVRYDESHGAFNFSSKHSIC